MAARRNGERSNTRKGRQRAERATIVNTVRMPMKLDANRRAIHGTGKVYRPGDEDALAKEQGSVLKGLEARGAVRGFGGGRKAASGDSGENGGGSEGTGRKSARKSARKRASK